jgi:diguanylate cyclase
LFESSLRTADSPAEIEQPLPWWQRILAAPLYGQAYERYQEQQSKRLLPAGRSMLLIVGVVILLFGFWDRLIDDEGAVRALLVRVFGASILFALVLLSRLPTHGGAWNRYVLLAQLLGQTTIAVAALQLNGGWLWALPGLMVLPLTGLLFLTQRRMALVAAIGHIALPMLALGLADAPPLERLNTVLFLLTSSMSGWLLHELFERARRRNFVLAEQLTKAATLDPLTGLSNRRHFVDMGTRLIARARRDQKPTCSLYVDIDHFKSINDRCGHHTGDEALVHMVQCCLNQLRPGDLFGRIGGEEFAVLLPSCNLSQARRVAERLRIAVERAPLDNGIGFTISLGLAQLGPESDTLERMLDRADEALLRAKRSGRNRVEVAPTLAVIG